MPSLTLSPGTISLVDASIPDGWRALQLRDFCDFAQGGRLGLTKQGDYVNSGVPAYSAAGQDGYVARTEYRDTRAVVLSAIGANCGRCFFAAGDWTTLANVQAIIPSQEVGDAHFLFYRVNRDDYWPRSGSAQPFIKPSDIKACWVALPPLTEQHGITQVLDTLDTTIRQTEAIIEKLKKVKQGLLHDLLTRGIGANGELRTPQSQAPHLYKDSPLGWIPREWEVCGVLDIAPAERQCILTGPFGAQLGQADFVTEGVPVLRIGNVQAGFIDWTDVQYVSRAKAGRLDRFSVLTGDLLFARQGATTGRNALADIRANGALINYHIIRVAVDQERCDPVYLHALFNSDQSKEQVDQEKGRGTREGINSKQIASLRFALPQIAEQRISVARMTALGTSMEAESRLLAKLRLQKSGLMDDLLTGRVRVTPLLA
jgi:type I restriction enzyme S subunit